MRSMQKINLWGVKMAKTIDIDLDRLDPLYPNQKITVILPMPVSLNHMYQTAGQKKRLTTKASQYIKTAQDITKKAIKEQGWHKDADGVWYVMDMYFFYPDKRIRDSHNYLKLLMDCLEGLLFPNDYFVLPRIQYVALDRDNPRLEIVYYPQGKEPYKYR